MNRPYENDRIILPETKYYLQTRLSSDFSIPDSGVEFIVDNWVRRNGDTAENLINGLWTTPSTGSYRITLNGTFFLTTAYDDWRPRMTIIKNDTNLSTEIVVARHFPGMTSVATLNCNVIEYLNKGDIIKIVTSVNYPSGNNLRLIGQAYSSLNFERIN